MRLTIPTTEFLRGDVQPYIALGLGLQAAGHHKVRIASATPTSSPWFRAFCWLRFSSRH